MSSLAEGLMFENNDGHICVRSEGGAEYLAHAKNLEILVNSILNFDVFSRRKVKYYLDTDSKGMGVAVVTGF